MRDDVASPWQDDFDSRDWRSWRASEWAERRSEWRRVEGAWGILDMTGPEFRCRSSFGFWNSLYVRSSIYTAWLLKGVIVLTRNDQCRRLNISPYRSF